MEPVARCPLQAEEQLDGLCSVRYRQRDSADKRVRHEERTGCRPAETDHGQDLSAWFGGEIQPRDSGCRRLLQPLPKPLRVDTRRIRRAYFLSDWTIEHEGSGSGEQYPGRSWIQRLPEWDRGAREVCQDGPVCGKLSAKYRDSRPD